MSAPGDLPISFVLGTGRCGSTLIHEILCRHRDVGFITNLDDRSAALARTATASGRIYRRLAPETTKKGRIRFAPSEAYNALTREVAPLFEQSDRDLVAGDATPWLANRLDRFFRARWEKQPEHHLLHKFTGWPRAGLLSAVFPATRFVHIVRDGRAVANSWLQMPWWLGYRGPEHWHFGPLSDAHRLEWEASGCSFVVLAGIAWKLLIDAHDAAHAAVGDDAWLELRYEDVLADPQTSFATMFDFLGVEPDPQFAAQLDRYSLDLGRTDAFRRDLGPEHLTALDSSLGGHLERFGYQIGAEE